MSEPIAIENLASEVGRKNFADERLNSRLRKLVTGLAVDPTLSLPRVFDSAGLEAAYRFFSNCKVTPDTILQSHIEATRARCEEQGNFLIVHDSTKFLYRFDGEREGLGHVRRAKAHGQQAFFAHVSLAVAADGTRRPLGVAEFSSWVRKVDHPVEESLRWERQLRSSAAALRGSKTAIHVMDREADDYQMFDSLLRDGHRFVVRCQFNRKLETELGSEKLYDALARASFTAEREVPLSRRKPTKDAVAEKIHPPRDARTATLSVSAGTFTFNRPQKRKRGTVSESIVVNVVRVSEPAPPEGEAPIEWVLLTKEPIDTPEQQLAIVDYYRARWTIEEYFKAVKSGCNFEKRQLEDYESLINLFAVFAPIAYRLLLIRSEARRIPDAPAIEVVSQDHIDVLRARGRIKLSDNPTTREIYLAIAALGGHLKHNGNPGWSTLSFGLAKLDTLTEGWVAAKLQFASDQ